MNLEYIKTQTTWNEASHGINSNFSKVGIEVEKLKNATTRDKGYYPAAEALTAAFPTASVGSRAFVGYTAPFSVYVWDTATRAWVDSGETVNTETPINLGDYYTKSEVDDKEAYLEGYAEEVANVAERNAKDYMDGKSAFLSAAEYEDLAESGAVEDKLYFVYED